MKCHHKDPCALVPAPAVLGFLPMAETASNTEAQKRSRNKNGGVLQRSAVMVAAGGATGRLTL